MDGATNCGFTTFEQRMETAPGLGSLCQPNTQYAPPGSHPLRGLQALSILSLGFRNSSGSFEKFTAMRLASAPF